MNSSMSKKLWRKALKEYFDCTCVYCGKRFPIHKLTIDHVIPKSAGGETVNSNLVAACEHCNQKKASKDWLEFIRSNYGLNKIREHIINKHTNGIS